MSLRNSSVKSAMPPIEPQLLPGPLLELAQVSYRFPSQRSGAIADRAALSDLSLSLEAGDRLALVGPSGAGKSTLLQLLNGTLLPSSGRVLAFGQEFATLSQGQRRRLQRQIGTVYQQFHLVPSLRVIHNVNVGQLGRWSLAKALWSLVFPQEVEAARAALAQVGIPDKLFARTDQLSGGQQQRVAIARVLLQNPPMILADEPVASLDPERSREVMALLTQLCAQQGRALVVSLHDLALAREFCDRIVGLREGRVMFDCAARELNPKQVSVLYKVS